MSAKERALSAWGDTPPDWIAALAAACDASSQSAVAKRLGYSAAVVNQALANKYPGRIEAVEMRVRERLMGTEVDCPELGRIEAAACRTHREADFSPASSFRVRMFRACHACPQNSKNAL